MLVKSGVTYSKSSTQFSVHLLTRFNWKTEDFPAEVSIVPAKGFINPGMEVPFQVTFAPVELISDTRYENLLCLVEGSSSVVTLIVTGSCIAASTSKEVGQKLPFAQIQCVIYMKLISLIVHNHENINKVLHYCFVFSKTTHLKQSSKYKSYNLYKLTEQIK